MAKATAKQLNRMLANRGLATLADPRNLLAQLALGIKTHEQFSRLLCKVEPENRYECYQSLRSFLGFDAKPLDVYLAMGAERAEKERLCVKDDTQPDGFRDFEPARNAKLEEKATNAIHDGLAWDKTERSLRLTCAKCTVESQFYGYSLVDAVQEARRIGWVYDKELNREICPKCPSPGWGIGHRAQ